MSLSRTERLFLAGFVVAGLLMLAAAALFIGSYVRGHRQDQWIDHTRRVIAEMDSAEVRVTSAADAARAESAGVDGAGDALAVALDAVLSHLGRLRVHTRDNPMQQVRIERIASLVELERARHAAGESTYDAALIEQLRSGLAQMKATERQLLTARIQESRDGARRRLYIMLALVAMSIGVTSSLGLALKRNLAWRRAIEAALRQSERHLQAIIDAAPNAVVTLDADQMITGLNPRAEQLFGWKRAELVGRAFAETMLATQANRALARLAVTARRVARRGHAETRVWLRARRQDGVEFPIELTLNGTRDERGDARLTAFIDDLTVREQTQHALADARDSAVQASNLKSEFLAHVSHELRTPLNGIIGMAGLLRDTRLDPEQAEFAETIRRSGEHLLTIINDLLDLSKVEAGKLMLETIEFDLELATRDVTDLVLPAARDKGLELVLRMAPDVPRYLRGDVGRVRQVLMNLLGNAVKFTAHGHVVISIHLVKRDDDRVTLRFAVEDTGIGVAEESRHLLFSSFVQADASTTRRFGGTGLGLSLSRQLVELMGGSIGFESSRGAGSIFWFELPFEPGSPGRALLSAEELGAARVLIVDDSEPARESIEEIVRSWRIAAAAVSNGAAALAHIRTAAADAQPYSIALIDSTLPDVDARELALTIRHDASLAGLRLVLLTLVVGRGANALDDYPGFDAVVAKPIRPSELLDGMASALGLRSAARSERTRGARPRRYDGVRVLLAEDNQVNQRVASTMLERMGCRIDIAGNGREAVDLAARLPYDVVFMDIQMPEMGGFEATETIRRAEAGRRRVPIIALTAHAMAGDREIGLAAGMDDYLTKPVRAEALAAMLDKFVARTKPAPEAAMPVTPGAGIDEGVIADLVDGDADLLANLLALFVESSREYLDAMRAGVDGGDAAAVSQAAHALRGATANFRAEGPVELARALENDAASGSLLGAGERVRALDVAVAATIASVERLVESLRRNAATR